MLELMQRDGVVIGDHLFRVILYLGGDLKWMTLAIGGSTSRSFCIYCGSGCTQQVEGHHSHRFLTSAEMIAELQHAPEVGDSDEEDAPPRRKVARAEVHLSIVQSIPPQRRLVDVGVHFLLRLVLRLEVCPGLLTQLYLSQYERKACSSRMRAGVDGMQISK
jgi:hypothetical protein